MLKQFVSLLFGLTFLFSNLNAEFGYISYEYSGNIGDEIQSIAARQFLPKEALNIPREYIGEYESKEKIHTLMNGWFWQHPEKIMWGLGDTAPAKKMWPPSESIDPLLISIHFNKATYPILFSNESREYLKNHGPVGARDYFTYQSLINNNIPAYFSGCLTLTLKNDLNFRENVIYAVDLNKKCIEYLRSKAKCPVIVITHYINNEIVKDPILRLHHANKLLNKYKKAKCVVTTRLHAAMPCLGLNTPVLLINTQADQYRFDGLRELVHNCSQTDFLTGAMKYNFNNPPKNPNAYLPIRENLIKTVTEWVNEKK